MASLYNAGLKPIAPGGKTHPYDHATKLFVADNFRLSPKQTFLYYVCLNINQDVAQGILSLVGAATESPSSQSLVEQYETGLLVKQIDLPKFTINTKIYNAYNRKNIVSNAIQYDAVSVTFHDDAANVVNNFWNDYYTYYYRDSDYQPELYGTDHKYTLRQRTKWGFTPRNRQLKPFLRDIQIFSLHNKRFTEYRLVNPVISSWRHGQHDSTESNGIMSNQMLVQYETVKYRTGTVNPVDVNGFAVLHYDNFQSPISDSITNIDTNAGVLGAIATAGSKDLARPDGTGSGRGIFSSLLTAYNTYNNIKNANFKSLAAVTIGQVGARIINGTVNNALTGYSFPTFNSTPGYSPNATSTVENNNQVGQTPYPNSISTSIGGAITVAAIGSAVNVGQSAQVNQSQALVERGVATGTEQRSPIAAAVVGQIGSAPSTVSVNPSSGQPIIGASTILIGDGKGGFVPSQLTTSTVGSAFNASDINVNRVGQQIFKDNNYTTTVNTYSDGTIIAFDDNNNILYTIPKGSQAYTPEQLSQLNTDALRNLNVNTVTGTRFVTDPVTGIVSAVGGTTAVVSNTITQGIAGVTGAVAGAKVYEALSKSGAGKGIFGQVLSAGVGAGVGAGIYKVSNNLLQPIINSGAGVVGQVFDEASQGIKNLFGTFTGSSGKTVDPTQNILKVEQSDLGGYITYYKDGSQILRTGSQETILKQGNATDFYQFQAGDIAAATNNPGAIVTDQQFNPSLRENTELQNQSTPEAEDSWTEWNDWSSTDQSRSSDYDYGGYDE